MHRKEFIKYGSLSSMALLASGSILSNRYLAITEKTIRPLAITMWDFSWLERRWPGGSYEDWDKVLDELVARGYNAVRIDAYPHLVEAGAKKEWTLLPQWDQNDWGSPGIIKVQVQPSLTQFIAKCKKRKIGVGLSTWYRQDTDNVRMQMETPEKMAANWLAVLNGLKEDGLLDAILYVDLCNEWPANVWTPFFKAERKGHDWSTAASMEWMKAAIAILKSSYPTIPYTFSFDHYEEGILQKNPAPFLDFIEQHIWMASLSGGEFNNKVGIEWNGFSASDTHRTVEKAETLYWGDKAHWDAILVNSIKQFATDAKAAGVPLMTTECWSVVNYKDYPMLNWNWVKDLCALGVTTAAATGQWIAIATSNFCGPQFAGMWGDVAWHQRLTKLIKSAPVNKTIQDSKISKRIMAMR